MAAQHSDRDRKITLKLHEATGALSPTSDYSNGSERKGGTCPRLCVTRRSRYGSVCGTRRARYGSVCGTRGRQDVSEFVAL